MGPPALVFLIESPDGHVNPPGLIRADQVNNVPKGRLWPCGTSDGLAIGLVSAFDAFQASEGVLFKADRAVANGGAMSV